MIRFLFRFAATVALCVAFLFAIADATRSIAGSTLVLTPLGQSWASTAPAGLAKAEAAVTGWGGAGLWSFVNATVLSVPGAFVFMVLALLFYALGRRPDRRIGQISASG